MQNSVTSYNAEISAGSLLLKESREIAKLLLSRTDDQGWHQAIIIDNVLQKKAPASSKRMSRLIRNRLEVMKPDLWKLVIHGSSDIAYQALLAAAIKHSRLLEDFLNQVIKEHFLTFNNQLTLNDWNKFLLDCENRDPSISEWSESTRRKLGQVIFRILAESRYIDSTRSMKIIPLQITPEVRHCLLENNENEIFECMNIANG